jgi:predicted dehydrogenase
MPIRVGVVGAGNIATSRHIPALQNHDRFEVTAVYDRNETRTATAAAEYDLRAADSFQDCYEAVDAVSLCTPPSVHRQQAVEALEAGCHVLCEKPMAMTDAEAAAMVEAADTNDRVLSVVHNFLYMDAIEETRDLIEAGDLGTITRTHMVKPESEEKRAKEYLDDAARPATATEEWKLYRLFWDEAAHLMYLTRDILGDMNLAEATATPTPVSTYGTISARFTTGDSADGNVTMLLDAPISEWWFVVVGTDGIVLVDIYRDLTIHFDREPDHSATRVLGVLLSGITQAGVGSVLSGLNLVTDRLLDDYRIPDAGFSTQLDHLADAIDHGRPLPTPPEEDRKAVAAMEAVVEATPMADGRQAADE